MKLSRKYIPTIIILLLLFSVAAGVAGYRWKQSSNISVFFEKTMRLTFENDPEQLDFYRPDFRNDISRYKSRLTALSLASANRKSEVAQNQIGELQKFDSAFLSLELQAQYELMHQYLVYRSKHGEYFPYWFPANPVNGVQVAIPQLFSQYHDLNRKEDCKAFIARLKIVDVKIGQAIKGIEARKEQGIFPPLELVERARQQITDFTSLPANRNPIYLGFSRKVVRMDPTE